MNLQCFQLKEKYKSGQMLSVPSVTDGENEAQRGEKLFSAQRLQSICSFKKSTDFCTMYLKISTLLFFVLLRLLASFAEDLLECENRSRMPTLFLYQRH